MVGSILGLAVADPTNQVQATGVVGEGFGAPNNNGYNQDVSGVSGFGQQSGLSKLSSTLSTTNGSISVLPVQATIFPIVAGTYTLWTNDGSGNSQTWDVTSNVAIGATSIPVTSQTPSYPFPTGSALGNSTPGVSTWNGNANGGYFTGEALLASSSRIATVRIENKNWFANDYGSISGAGLTTAIWARTLGQFMNGSVLQIGGGSGIIGGGGATAGAREDSGCSATVGNSYVTDPSAVSTDVGGIFFASTIVPVGTTIASVVGSQVNLAAGVTVKATSSSFTGYVSGPTTGHYAPQWNYGIMAIDTDPVKSALVADYGYSIASLLVEGTHAGASLAIATAAGTAIIGNTPREDRDVSLGGTASVSLNATDVVLDSSCVGSDLYSAVSGPGIPVGTYIASVSAGVSFTMSNASTYTGTGAVIVGGARASTGTSMLELQTTTSDALGALTIGNPVVSAHQSSIEWSTGAGGGRIGVGGTNQMMTGASSGDLVLQPLGSSGHVQLGGSSTVFKASFDNKLSFFGAAATAQYSGAVGANGFTQNSGTSMNAASSSTGNVGTSAFTFADLVRAMKDYGLLPQ